MIAWLAYWNPHSVGLDALRSSNAFPLARCRASTSLRRFAVRFQFVRFANIAIKIYHADRGQVTGNRAQPVRVWGLQLPNYQITQSPNFSEFAANFPALVSFNPCSPSRSSILASSAPSSAPFQ